MGSELNHNNSKGNIEKEELKFVRNIFFPGRV